MRSGARVVRVGLVGFAALGAAARLARAIRSIDVAATLRAVAEVGPLAPLALAPFLAAMALDATGMLLLLRSLGRAVPFARLLPIRIATEALHVTAPAGFVVADSAAAALLDTQCGVPLGQGAVLAIARKWLVMRAHAAYIIFGAACGAAVLAGVSARGLGGTWLPWAVCGSALVPLAMSLGLGASFGGPAPVARLRSFVARIPWRSLRRRAASWKAAADAVDSDLTRVGSEASATWAAAALFLGCWLLESFETALLVRLVGGPFDLRLALAAEVGISLVRSIGNVAPAGLGVQEASYLTLLPAMGLPAPIAAAFMVLRRAKEAVWIGVGYGFLGTMRQENVPLDPRRIERVSSMTTVEPRRATRP